MRASCFWILAIWSILAALEAPPAYAQYDGGLAERPFLTGDWFGARSSLAARGVDFHVSATQFYQGVASGGNQQEFEYGGKLDYYLNADGGKLGLRDGLFLNMHAETRFGQSVNNIDGLLAPSNIVMMFPEPNNHLTSITGFKLTQSLSENLAVFAGKINTLDEYPLQYNGGPGLGGFMNTSLVFNPIVMRTIPYSAAGVGFAVFRDGKPLFSFTVFDPQERAAEGLEDLFAQGVLLVPDLTFHVKPFGRPGEYNFGATYSNRKYRSTDPSAWLIIPGEPVQGALESGSWSAYANFYQSLWVDATDDTRNWGIFFQSGLSDGNPNPIRSVLNGGIGGRSPLRSNSLDTFGIGYFFVGLSSSFKQLTAPFIAQQDEQGVELFYNYAVTPWCRLTVDLQVAEPSTVGYNTVILPCMRLQMLF
jgi:porin